LLFDLDNTLLDFDAGASYSLKKTLTEFGLPLDAGLINSYYTINKDCWSRFEQGLIDTPTLRRERFSLFVSANGLLVDAAEMNRYYLDTLSNQALEIHGARPLLESSFERYQLVLATNGFAEIQYPRIKLSRFESFFTHKVISEEIGHSKPSPHFFAHAMDLMGSPSPDTVMIIGDSLSSDIKGGLGAGIMTCWFNPKKIKNETGIEPHFTATSLDQILQLLN